MTIPTVTYSRRSPRIQRAAELSNLILAALRDNPEGLNMSGIAKAIGVNRCDNVCKAVRRTQEWLTTQRHPLRIRIVSGHNQKIVTLEKIKR